MTTENETNGKPALVARHRTGGLTPQVPAKNGASRGFSLIELMVVVTVAAVLIAVAAPGLTDMATSAKLNAEGDRWVATTQQARSEAIKRNRVVTMCAWTGALDANDQPVCATSGGAQAWGSGWVVGFTDAGTWTVIERSPATASGYRMEVTSGSNAVYAVAFQPSGVGSGTATATVCRSTPAGNLQQRTIQLSITGRTTLNKTPRTTACPTS
jgi:type IV fimbrial biogenesis protein FimT